MIVCLFQLIVMSVIVKLGKSLISESDSQRVSVKVSTSVVESANINQQVDQSSGTSSSTARKQRSTHPRAQDLQLLLEPKKLQQFRTEDAVIVANQRPLEYSTEPINRINYFTKQNDYSMNPQPSSIGRILDNDQLNYFKPTISTSYSISPPYGTQEPQHRMVSRQANSIMLRDKAASAGSISLKHDSQSGSDFSCHRRSLGRMLKGKISI